MLDTTEVLAEGAKSWRQVDRLPRNMARVDMKAINLQNTIYLLGENTIQLLLVIKEAQHFYHLPGGETEAGSIMKAIIKYESEKETWEIEKKEMFVKRKMHAVGVITTTKDIYKDICKK